MKATIKVEKEVDIKTLHVQAGVRYWEDATVNELADEEGDRIPCRVNDCWCPVIDIDTGVITNWIKGVTADIHYKVCDAGHYELKDIEGEVVATQEGYVPTIMCPEKNGYGDYIKMKVDENGQIANWVPLIDDFFEED
jgi:hypothetical protein